MFDPILIRVVSLIVLCVSTPSSWGRVDDGPPIAGNHLTLPMTATKDGFSLTRLDLLTVVLPGGHPADWRVEMEPAGQDVVIALSEAEFQNHLDNHRFLTVHTIKNSRLTEGKTPANAGVLRVQQAEMNGTRPKNQEERDDRSNQG